MDIYRRWKGVECLEKCIKWCQKKGDLEIKMSNITELEIFYWLMRRIKKFIVLEIRKIHNLPAMEKN